MTRKEIIVSDISQKDMADLIHLACIFESDVLLESCQYRINAKSLLGVMAFHPTDGMAVNITTSGKDEQEALSAVEDFLIKK